MGDVALALLLALTFTYLPPVLAFAVVFVVCYLGVVALRIASTGSPSKQLAASRPSTTVCSRAESLACLHSDNSSVVQGNCVDWCDHNNNIKLVPLLDMTVVPTAPLTAASTSMATAPASSRPNLAPTPVQPAGKAARRILGARVLAPPAEPWELPPPCLTPDLIETPPVPPEAPSTGSRVGPQTPDSDILAWPPRAPEGWEFSRPSLSPDFADVLVAPKAPSKRVQSQTFGSDILVWPHVPETWELPRPSFSPDTIAFLRASPAPQGPTTVTSVNCRTSDANSPVWPRRAPTWKRPHQSFAGVTQHASATLPQATRLHRPLPRPPTKSDNSNAIRAAAVARLTAAHNTRVARLHTSGQHAEHYRPAFGSLTFPIPHPYRHVSPQYPQPAAAFAFNHAPSTPEGNFSFYPAAAQHSAYTSSQGSSQLSTGLYPHTPTTQGHLNGNVVNVLEPAPSSIDKSHKFLPDDGLPEIHCPRPRKWTTIFPKVLSDYGCGFDNAAQPTPATAQATESRGPVNCPGSNSLSTWSGTSTSMGEEPQYRRMRNIPRRSATRLSSDSSPSPITPPRYLHVTSHTFRNRPWPVFGPGTSVVQRVSVKPRSPTDWVDMELPQPLIPPGVRRLVYTIDYDHVNRLTWCKGPGEVWELPESVEEIVIHVVNGNFVQYSPSKLFRVKWDGVDRARVVGVEESANKPSLGGIRTIASWAELEDRLAPQPGMAAAMDDLVHSLVGLASPKRKITLVGVDDWNPLWLNTFARTDPRKFVDRFVTMASSLLKPDQQHLLECFAFPSEDGYMREIGREAFEIETERPAV